MPTFDELQLAISILDKASTDLDRRAREELGIAPVMYMDGVPLQVGDTIQFELPPRFKPKQQTIKEIIEADYCVIEIDGKRLLSDE